MRAAVYVPFVDGEPVPLYSGDSEDESMQSLIQRFEELHQQSQQQGRCKLDVVLCASNATSLKDALWYPVNELRNFALKEVHTELVFLLDVDFRPSEALNDIMGNEEQYQAFKAVTLQRVVWVVPAFELFRTAKNPEDWQLEKVASEAVSGGKPVLTALWGQGLLAPFHIANVYGHGSTDFPRWNTTTTEYDITDAMLDSPQFEPYIIMAYKYVPWYDERFRGRIANKAVHIWAVQRFGFGFRVHPSAFVLHLPHEHIQRLSAIDVFYPHLKDKFQQKNGAILKDLHQEKQQFGYLLPRSREGCQQQPDRVGPIASIADVL